MSKEELTPEEFKARVERMRELASELADLADGSIVMAFLENPFKKGVEGDALLLQGTGSPCNLGKSLGAYAMTEEGVRTYMGRVEHAFEHAYAYVAKEIREAEESVEQVLRETGNETQKEPKDDNVLFSVGNITVMQPTVIDLNNPDSDLGTQLVSALKDFLTQKRGEQKDGKQSEGPQKEGSPEDGGIPTEPDQGSGNQ